MRICRFFSWIFAALAICLAALTLYICMRYTATEPMLLTPAGDARDRAVEMLDAICLGDYSGAEKILLGNPSLGADRQPEDPVGVLIWDAFVDSLSYELMGDCYATDSGVALDVCIHSLDISSVTASLSSRSHSLLEQRVAEAENVSLVYDANNQYREDVVMEVLFQAAQDSLAQDSRFTASLLTLNMVYRDGQWWIVPDNALTQAVSGGFAG